MEEEVGQQQKPIVRKLEEQQQLVNQKQDQATQVIKDVIQQPPLQQVAQGKIADTTLEDLDLNLLNRYKPKTLTLSLPSPDILNQLTTDQLEQLRKIVGGIISTQMRANSRSHKQGQAPALRNAADTYRNYIDYYLRAKPKRRDDDDDEVEGSGIKYYQSNDELVSRLNLWER